MIYRDCNITITDGVATIDEPIILYRGDREVELYFTIKECRYKFADATNLITTTEASYAQMLIKVPGDKSPIFGEILPTKEGKAVLTISSSMIDEIEELGLYNFQIRLYDDSKTSRVTIPPIEKGIEIKEPIAMEDTINKTGIASLGYAKIWERATQRDTLNIDGTYNKKTWKQKETIYESDLNTLEDIASKNRQSIINDEKEIATLKSKTSTLETTTSSHTSTLSTHTSQIADLQKEVGQTSESVEGSYITASGSKDGSITDMEMLGNTVQDSSNLADIQSVGTLRKDGLYEMSILSCGKNLFNINSLIRRSYINGSTGEVTPVGDSTSPAVSNFIKAKPNTNYIISFENPRGTYFAEYDANNKFIKKSTQVTKLTTSENTRYIKVQIGLVTSDEIQKIQIEEGTVTTTCEPYQGNKSSILLPCQLEKVGDVSDRLFRKEDGIWCVEKNIGNKVLNGSEGFYTMNRDGVNTVAYQTPSNFSKGITNSVIGIISNKLEGVSANTLYSTDTGKECICVNNLGNLQIRLNKTRVISTFAEAIKTLEVLVKYQLATPQIIELPLDTQIQLNSFAGTTHVFTENTVIEPTIKCTIPKSLGASVQSLNDKTDILSDRIEKVETLQEGNELEVSTDKGYVVCENTNNGQIEELKIEGKSLVNLWNLKFGTGKTGLVVSSIDNAKNDYTLIAFTENFTGQLNCQLSTDNINYGNDYELISPTTNNTSITVKKLSKQRQGVNAINYGFYLLNNTQGTVKLVVLEGDHTNNPPSYFEGLKSVGDGVDKIEVLSRKEDGDLFDGQLEVGGINANNGEINLTYDRVRSKNFIRVLSKKINISRSVGNDILYLYEYNGSFKYNLTNPKAINRNILNASISLNDDTKYIKIADKSNNINSQIQIRNDYVTTNYESYSQNKKQILIQNSDGNYEKPVLRSAGSVSDTIEKYSDGKYYYHKRCEEVVFDGSSDENWLNPTNYTDTMKFALLVSYAQGNVNNVTVISDRFASSIDNTNYENKEGVCGRGGNTGFNIQILKTKLSSQNVEGFKAWLQSNPVTVVYQLATEEVYECVNLDLDSYEGETSVIFDGGAISPKITFKISSHIGNTISVLKDRINYLENKVIEMFKLVLAGNVQTLAYELYPNDFKDIEYIETGEDAEQL